MNTTSLLLYCFIVTFTPGPTNIVINLSHAILSEKDEALCNELLVTLTDSLVQTNLFSDDKKDAPLMRKAKDMLHTNLDTVLEEIK